ncbi:uncharacterized protein LOC126480776 isoform X1 [Schistocerca serialis cubense]|uniref:uncharacterized protein LOC126480776 isoform X1 n=1 Tax=Schistocerca serialis cubense TaxID=2023355 RepID=UPI00214E0B10|nr:uncharacterized protein LOC126480776 isoform X1 [Schistocerca serialis cubense]
MDTLGIIFELQWKKKQGVAGSGEDIASIGIWDMPDASLDWMSFKSYLSQNLGTAEDINFSYVDSEGDEIPIQSECEFQEALKFARQRARRGRGIVLKLDRPNVTDNTIQNTQTETSVQGVTAKFSKLGVVRRHEKPKSAKPASTRPAAKILAPVEKAKRIVAAVGSTQPPKSNKINSEEIRDDIPPLWFKRYMHKMKGEIVAEVTSQVTYELHQAIVDLKKTWHSSEKTSASIDASCTKKKKKKISDEESSDANVVEQREYKLLRKIEKLQKREKRLEKKLDAKLEKLENRTKRMLEKKSHSKSRSETLPEKKSLNRKRVDVPVGTYLMDAVLLNVGSKPDLHIKLGESFTKVWEIMNTGTLPWTDKTELRLAWGTTGLEPQVTTVKCPALEPGERGQICVTFKAPEFAGTFESYWHFYHMGVRFGHWISCAIIVDPNDEPQNIYSGCDSGPATDNFLENFDNKSRNDHAVDLTVRSKCDEIFESASLPKCETVSSNVMNSNENQKNPEYESDSESDNMSIVSHTISVTSESGDEDKFVVVSMPASSTTEDNCCAASDSSEMVLINPESSTTTTTVATTTATTTIVTTAATSIMSTTSTTPIVSTASAASCLHPKKSGTEAIQARQQKKMPMEDQSADSSTSEKQLSDMAQSSNATVNAECGASQFNLKKELMQPSQKSKVYSTFDLPHTLKNNGNLKNIIFAVDTRGKTVPIKVTNRPKKLNVNNHSSLSSNDSKASSDEQVASMENCEEANAEMNTTTTNHVHEFRYEAPLHHASQNDSEHSQPTSPKREAQSSLTENSANIIHILPETLMTGAVNVATSAFSTAKAVISNLRTIPARTANNASWEAGAPPHSSDTGLTTSQCMATLTEMGFTNKELNLSLLNRCDNDISRVISVLLSYGEENNSID